MKGDTWNLWTRAWYIIGRHAEVNLIADNTVTCKICGQIYDSYSRMTGGNHGIQGHEICAWSKQLPDGRWVIHCGYGSEFDLSEFWYLKDFPEKSVDGICDWCLRRMARDGIIMKSGKELSIDGGYLGDV